LKFRQQISEEQHRFTKQLSELKFRKPKSSEQRWGSFPQTENVSGAIVQGEDYRPSTEGVLAYLIGGNDLQTVLDKIENNNGKIIVPKTQISPELGYFGMFIDTEGNKIAVHSMH